MYLAVAPSYLTKITWHMAYNTLSHVYFLAFLGVVTFTYVVSTTRCIYTCPVSSGMWPRLPSDVVWVIGVSEGIYTFSRSDTENVWSDFRASVNWISPENPITSANVIQAADFCIRLCITFIRYFIPLFICRTIVRKRASRTLQNNSFRVT